jgi:hypothetical protein
MKYATRPSAVHLFNLDNFFLLPNRDVEIFQMTQNVPMNFPNGATFLLIIFFVVL